MQLMSNGDNHAKQIVIDEAKSLADDLQNGHAGDPHTQGKAIALIVKMITPLYQASFMTTEECRLTRKEVGVKSHKTSKIKIGPVQIEGPVVGVLLSHFIPVACCCIAMYAVGKLQNWW